jgi:2'-5' RNA ligase
MPGRRGDLWRALAYVGGVLHAIELLPDEAGAEQVRRDWRALRDAGLPSQLDHRGATNAPHVTLVAAPTIAAAAEELAVERIGPLLPLTARTAGLVLLGGTRVTVARLVEVDDAVVAAAAAVRKGVPGRQHRSWLPHVTLARRLPRADVQRAVDLLGHEDVALTLTSLRRWDPGAGSVRTLAPR